MTQLFTWKNKKLLRKLCFEDVFSMIRDSAWRRQAFGDVIFQPIPNFLKVLVFIVTRNDPLYPR